MSQFINKTSLSVIVFASIFLALTTGSVSRALSGSDWSASNIINDSTFLNSSSMSANDIQSFLNTMVPNCDTWGSQPSEFGGGTRADWATARGYAPPYTCLKDYSQNGQSAAQIIKTAADQQGINPKAIIVLLQKEQGLVTDTWPLESQYRAATGYGCPDTAPCDAQYYGLYNQVNKAAYQFKLYATYPTQYRYKAYQDNFIQWNPTAECGGSTVRIQNQATAGLYNYTPYQPNAAALNNLYGSGDGCSAYGNRNFWRTFSDWFGSTQYEESLLSFKSHISYYGWTASGTNRGATGFTGQGKSMEAFRVDGDVEYSSYNYTSGWQPTVRDGMTSGTTGQNKSIQAIKLNPTGSLAQRYDLYYRAHVSYIGWMDWTKNGQPAGVTGDSGKNIEAFEIQLVPKGLGAPGATGTPYQNINTATGSSPLSLSISSHVGSMGWQPTVTDSMTTGTTERSRPIEAIKIDLNNQTGSTGGIAYSTHLAGIGWQNIKSNGEVSGTTGESRKMEAIRINLTGQLADNYDIWYRGYVQYMGWLNWNKNGQPVGSVGASRQLEAVDIRLVPKNSVTLPQSGSLYNPGNQPLPSEYSISYKSHVGYIGWMNEVSANTVSGTIGQSKYIEALQVNSSNTILGDVAITCSAHTQGSGWSDGVSPGNTCGTVGQTKPLEAIKLGLSGSAADKYDVYYKVHLSWLGWQEWAKNNEPAGTPASGKPIEAVLVKLVRK